MISALVQSPFFRNKSGGLYPSNLMTLRADLKATFDEGHFLLVPYRGEIVAVFLTEGTRDLAHACHLRMAEIPTRIRRAFLYARFAWGIFKISREFLDAATRNDESFMTVPIPERLSKRKAEEGLKSHKKNKSLREADDDDSPVEPLPDLYGLTDQDVALLEAIYADRPLRKSQ